LQHVEDKPLLDRLAHAVQAERGAAAAVVVPVAEQLEGLLPGRGGERERAHVLLRPAGPHLGDELVLDVLLQHVLPLRVLEALDSCLLCPRPGGRPAASVLRGLPGPEWRPAPGGGCVRRRGSIS
jgi:hypothetical protein